MTIRSKPSTAAYRSGWDETFGPRLTPQERAAVTEVAQRAFPRDGVAADDYVVLANDHPPGDERAEEPEVVPAEQQGEGSAGITPPPAGEQEHPSGHE